MELEEIQHLINEFIKTKNQNPSIILIHPDSYEKLSEYMKKYHGMSAERMNEDYYFKGARLIKTEDIQKGIVKIH